MEGPWAMKALRREGPWTMDVQPPDATHGYSVVTLRAGQTFYITISGGGGPEPSWMYTHPEAMGLELLRALNADAKPERRCPDCGAELSCCGPMTADGPSMDCRECQQREKLAEFVKERDHWKAEAEAARSLLHPNGVAALADQLKDTDYPVKKAAYKKAREANS